MHYEPQPMPNLENILPYIGSSQYFSSYVEIDPGIFKYPKLLDIYHSEAP